MARQIRPRRIPVTRYYDPQGRRCAKGTPGARKVVEETETWYATIPGEGRVSLGTTDEGAAWQRLRERLRDRELRAAGVRDSLTDAAALPLGEHLGAWAAHLESRGLSRQHRQERRAQLLRLSSLAGWGRLADLDADSCRRALARLEAAGVGAGARRNYLAAAKSFCRWCVETGRLASHPLAGVRAPDAGADVRHERRLATPEELHFLFNHLAGPSARTRRHLTPAQRAIMYRLALGCGLRVGEVARLPLAAVDLDAATVTIAAAHDKRRRRAVLPLPARLADDLRAYLAAGGQWWEPRNKRSLTAALVRDLADAGVEYEVQGPEGPLFLDFHSLRHWYITQLAHQPGISPKVLLELARHADPKLTLRTYARAQESQKRAAAEGIPLP